MHSLSNHIRYFLTTGEFYIYTSNTDQLTDGGIKLGFFLSKLQIYKV